ncbi:MAG TPA: 3D domain-containing protein [Pyrinomonadaceae bacterium]|nr:3D domain-containing protein [Pyrinomonadaceae bacterium]
MKVYSIFSGSALIGAALLSSSLFFSARTLSAETLPSQQIQQPNSKPTTADATAPVALEVPSRGNLGKDIAEQEHYVVPPTAYVATAYSLRGRTASGQMVAKGLIAADPRHLPLGSRVRIEAGAYSGEYLVADTGGLVRGRRIDIWTPSSREAMRFGRRTVKLTVLSFGARKRTSRS